MMTTLINIFRIHIATNTNRFLYYLKRIPLIGKRIPDRVYSDGDLKLIVAIVAAIVTIFRKLVGKAVYVGLMLALPLFLIFKEIPKELDAEAFVHMFFFLSFLAGTVQISTILETNKNKYICIKLLRFGARDFVIPTMFSKHFLDLIFFAPAVMIVYLIFHAPVWQGLILLVLLSTFRFMYEALQLIIFEKSGKILLKKPIIQWAVIIPACMAAYWPLYFSMVWPIQKVLFSYPVILLLLFGAAVSIRYILKYPNIKSAVEATITLDDIMVDYAKIKSDALFGGVKIKEKEFAGSNLNSGKYDKKFGYEYLNAIFFDRHRKLMEAPIIRMLCIIAGCLLISILLAFLFPQVADDLDGELTSLLPVFVFIMYFTSLGDKICKAMFYNCDISLLRYSFYREKGVIRKNFVVRLKKVISLNMIIGLGIVVAMLIFLLAAGIAFEQLDFILFAVSILCLSVFFSVHHLFLYYVFQPYTTELGMKNPFFRLINTLVYLACFGSLQLKNVPGYFTVAVIGATIFYIVVALLLVYRLAPKNFRVK